ncbi:MAG: hypothetical protein ACI9U0_001285 [Flavobacteriales bacterium]|jgi:hypothetical protein|tara:strand:- start:4142 stop:5767 length:1626 start_codon:yes stop_codon:yes gene_type:complete
MNKNTFSFLQKLSFILTIIVLSQGCGQRGTPTGGDKDQTAPEVQVSTPVNNATNFKGKEIVFKFDEYVKASGFYNELLISPPLNSKPTHKLVGKKLILKLDSALVPNTTYSVFLGKGIKDLNEGNPLEDNLLVFSTGDVIDSLSLSGEIYNAESMETLNEGMVHLYKSNDDSVQSKKIPAYFAKVENGHFHFHNLTEGSYKIFALVDNNTNYLYDLPAEKIAFREELVLVSNQVDSSGIILKAFEQAEKKNFISSSNCDFIGKIDLIFNLPVENFYMKVIDVGYTKMSASSQFKASDDSLTIWFESKPERDSILLAVKYDSKTDTLKFNLKNRKSIATQKIYAQHNFSGMGNYHKKPLFISFTQPIRSIDTNKLVLISDVDTVQAKFKSSGTLSRYQLLNTLQESKIYILTLLPNAITSIFDAQNKDTLKVKFSTTALASLSNMSLKYDFSGVKGKGILEIWNGGGLVEKKVLSTKKGSVQLLGIKPGEYKLKYIDDTDDNQEWTSGNYWTKQQPESVYWYTESINLRANWDLDVQWTLKP